MFMLWYGLALSVVIGLAVGNGQLGFAAFGFSGYSQNCVESNR